MNRNLTLKLGAIALLILSFIPVLNLIAAPLWLLFGIWMMAIQYIDYPADNHKLGWNEMLAWLREKRWQSMSFGGIVYLVLFCLKQVGLPHNYLLLYAGWFLLAWISCGFALILTGLAMRYETFERVVGLISYILIPVSGVFFMVAWLPPSVRDIYLFVPFPHGVEMAGFIVVFVNGFNRQGADRNAGNGAVDELVHFVFIAVAFGF